MASKLMAEDDPGIMKARWRLKKEMQRAIATISPGGKRKLVAEWKEKYSDIVYAELLRCAKSNTAKYVIADWDLGEESKC